VYRRREKLIKTQTLVSSFQPGQAVQITTPAFTVFIIFFMTKPSTAWFKNKNVIEGLRFLLRPFSHHQPIRDG
jgi:hypothetical protein